MKKYDEENGPRRVILKTRLSNGRSHEYRTETRRSLAYWETQKHEFPVMHKLANRIMFIPASSCQIEQKFSRINHQASEHRTSLKSATITHLVQTSTAENFIRILKSATLTRDDPAESTQVNATTSDSFDSSQSPY